MIAVLIILNIFLFVMLKKAIGRINQLTDYCISLEVERSELEHQLFRFRGMSYED